MVTMAEELETWVLNTPGRIHLTVEGEYGKRRPITAKGKGQKIRLTANDRRLVQEGIRDPQNDPFKNGKLYRDDRTEEEMAAEPPSDQEMKDEDLIVAFTLEGDDFEEAVKAFSEVNVRRLRDLAVDVDAKSSQVAFLNEYIAETWPIGTDTPTYRELQQVPDNAL